MPDSSTFLQIEAGAHSGAFGNNTIPTPTDAQCKVGNYKLGRIALHGLSIAIEQPRGTYRTGMDANGKRWSSRMAAHYGYIAGTKGNDGDEVDCFIGYYPQSELAFVVNQNIAGRFDEVKVMLCFPDEESARRAYADSYERGWTGLASIVTASISQFKWWLKNGNMTRPLKPEHLPHEGLEAMTRRTQWSADALPYDQTLDQVLYDIRRSDGGEGLLLDSVSMADILEDSDGAYILDAMVVPKAGLERKMNAMMRVMERAAQEVKPVAVQIDAPFTQRGVANMAAIFELSDGQTVSIYFHNPDVTPKKMAPTDELISWRWLLNKKDITAVVAPERGQDLNVNEVARRIMKLAEKNSAAFVRANGKRAERMQRLADLNTEIAGLEVELKVAQNELEAAKVEAEDRAARPAPAPTTAQRAAALASDFVSDFPDFTAEEMGEVLARLETDRGWEIDRPGELKNALYGERAQRKNRAELAALMARGPSAEAWVNKEQPKVEFDPRMYGPGANYAQGPDNTEESEAAGFDAPRGAAPAPATQPAAPAYDFQARKSAIAGALQALGWSGGDYPAKGDSAAKFERATAGPKISIIKGSGAVVVASFADDLTKTPAELAVQIDAAATRASTLRSSDPREDARRAAAEIQRELSARISKITTILVDAGMTGVGVEDRFTKGGVSVFYRVGDIDIQQRLGMELKPFLRFTVKSVGSAAKDVEDSLDVLPQVTADRVLAYVNALIPVAVPTEPDLITTVDAAYQFTDATDAFKREVADSMDKAEYSTFATAKAMDLKAKALGLSIAWGVGKAVLDSAGEDGDDEGDDEGDGEDDFDEEDEWDATPEDEGDEVEPILDGDFKGHPFRGNQHKKAGYSSRVAVNSSIKAKRAERSGDAKEAAKAHKDAHDIHRAAAVFATGNTKKYHKKMAKFHDRRVSAGVMDSALLDAAGAVKTIIGKIKRAAKVIGRAMVGGDGKAMVYVGASGTERVKSPTGRSAMWSDDDAAGMLDYLVAVPAPEPAQTPAPEPDTNIGRKWNARYGVTEIIERKGDRYYTMVDGKTGGAPIILASELESHISLDERKAAEHEQWLKEVAEKEAAEAAEKQAKDAEYADIGEVEGESAMARGRRVSALSGLIRHDGTVKTKKKMVEDLVVSGEITSVSQENRIQPMSRTAYNRATNQEQAAHEKKIAAGGKVNVYQLGDSIIDKTAYDYANYLIGKKANMTPQDTTPPAADPAKAADTTYLQSLIDGTADMFAPDIFERLEPMFAKYENDAAMMAMLERAAQAYGDSAVKAAQAALATA